jgi:hypothetical protein
VRSTTQGDSYTHVRLRRRSHGVNCMYLNFTRKGEYYTVTSSVRCNAFYEIVYYEVSDVLEYPRRYDYRRCPRVSCVYTLR